MADQEYRVKLDLFEGPLDLLLFLIRKNELDIYDIPIATITEQYLEYLDLMRSLNVNLAADFLTMAATLVHIKSKTLLPSHADDEDEEDPRMEIVRPLLEYMKMKEAATILEEREMLNRDVFIRDFVAEELQELDEDRELAPVSLYDLLKAFKQIMEQRAVAKNVRLPSERISVQEFMEEIMEKLQERERLIFLELFPSDATKEVLITMFLAVLELVKLGRVGVFQDMVGHTISLFLPGKAAGEANAQ